MEVLLFAVLFLAGLTTLGVKPEENKMEGEDIIPLMMEAERQRSLPIISPFTEKKCFGDLGCFSMFPRLFFPETPEYIGAELRLHTPVRSLRDDNYTICRSRSLV